MGWLSGMWHCCDWGVFRHRALIVQLQIYLYTNQLADRGVRKMEKKNVMFTKDGMKVGVKEVKAEDYADRTQR
ncbi:hypothetical protein CC78DRAFT_529995 [Lojkania enalia]|uniref:Uncharacterized protein n=1 Tax=Lojkania enalia TaxID=147567 RepID=A0A9P4KG69_9PLEO|nr:hypothetical protein CC78DRAFT_529995 [Didymosphaeria enalia]